MKPIKHLRWWIVWTLFCSTTINYIDRQTLSVLAPFIVITRHGQQVPLSDSDYAHIVFWFQIAYAVMWL